MFVTDELTKNVKIYSESKFIYKEILTVIL